MPALRASSPSSPLFGEPQRRDGGAAQGSGFVVSEDGYILTNSHVITTAGEGAAGDTPRRPRPVYVEFRDGDRVAGARSWAGTSSTTSASSRSIPTDHELIPVPLGDSSRVVVGEPVAAIGSPFGQESSLTVGVVSATERSIESLTSEYDLVDAIQTDAPINRGNSGGPHVRRPGARDRHQRPDPQRVRHRGGRRLRRADQLGEALDGAADRDRRGAVRLVGRHDADRDAEAGASASTIGPEHGAAVQDVVADSPAAARRPPRRRRRSGSSTGIPFRPGGDLIVAIDGKPRSRRPRTSSAQ